MKPIAYEPHPVNPERKAELLAAGFKIIDARFAPAGEAPGGEMAANDVTSVAQRRGRPRRVRD
jgi:hypothetical protein